MMNRTTIPSLVSGIFFFIALGAPAALSAASCPKTVISKVKDKSTGYVKQLRPRTKLEKKFKGMNGRWVCMYYKKFFMDAANATLPCNKNNLVLTAPAAGVSSASFGFRSSKLLPGKKRCFFWVRYNFTK